MSGKGAFTAWTKDALEYIKWNDARQSEVISTNRQVHQDEILFAAFYLYCVHSFLRLDGVANSSRCNAGEPDDHISAPVWKFLEKISLEESSNFSTYVLELEHGWLVYRKVGFGGEMAFVPKPDKN